MKKRKLKGLFVKALAGVCVMGLLAGCGGAKTESAQMFTAANSAGSSTQYKGDSYSGMWSESASEATYDSYSDMAPAPDGGKAEQVKESSNTKRKLIKTVNMSVETQEFESLMSSIENSVKELDGYIQSLTSNNGSKYSGGRARRTASMVVRIPQARLDEFTGSISDLANIISRTENVDDITLTYVDLKSHKESLQVEQERLLNLLERAEILEDIITLENRLTNVRYQIESMESQLRTYDDQVDYSTVYLSVEEVQVYTPVHEDTPMEKMMKGLEESLTNIRDGVMNFGIWVVVKSPYLVIWGVVIGVALLVIRRRTKKIKMRNAQAAQNAEKKQETSEGNSSTEEKHSGEGND